MQTASSTESPTAGGANRRAGRFRLPILVGALALACLCGGAPLVPLRLERPGQLEEAVVLLHGLARTSRSMERMGRELADAGYTVYSLRYPSRRKTVERIAEEDLAPMLARCQKGKPRKIHFVAHSLGNIVVRQYLATHQIPQLGRVVMLGPPNGGSEVVDRLGSLRLFRWINGPAGLQLGTSKDALPARLPPPACEVGVIAGTRSINWILSSIIPGPDDGKVSVERARLARMAGFVTVPTAHPFLMQNRKVIGLTVAFLRDGTFGPVRTGKP